ncbi:MAG: 3-oxoacyl-[acyl-carrier-protein] reductase [Syntrophomonas sp.]|uniref:3-oxoacyl-[acyl-carrier-protein] reductase n=1 Tax=Syntrophomonas sp. TaxID=2053627 RepID=UPI00260BAAF5|nr:3-oxoacyl-[acyl-carrier-protein] reductase [Syntrophomonas sp.]MDD2509828.1 3-oxoacyl-[acyl-carrier-protein] reductase [Syntrophomonas sp.]MDD4625612.1 3-oxoacyl-[acyl-carrier-protein] reductase [Syntrophomonas sp.]
MDMNSKVALVTGSSRGIGRTIALKLAREGYRVAVNYYNNPQEAPERIKENQEQAQEVLQEIEAAGSSGIVLGADVSDPAMARELVEAVIKEYGQIDVLVNNAGINKDQLILRIKDEEWDKLINTNLSSAFYCCREALKQMVRKRYGRIINISSVVGLSGNAGQAHYAASKSGLLGLTFSIAREYGVRGITANVIAPGYIQSDMTAGFSPEQKEKMLSAIALGRLGTPEDIAGVVVFLASDAAAYLTAQVIKVDGGMS